MKPIRIIKPINIIILILHNRSERYYGFRFIRCSDGATVEGKISGGESNVRAALTQNHDVRQGPVWREDYFYTYKQIKEKEIFALPYAGCDPKEIYDWVQNQLPKENE